MKSIVILSGGLDSSTCLYIAREAGGEIYPISFRYGQRHVREVEQARLIAEAAKVKELRVVDLPTPRSALTGAGEVPTGRNLEQMAEVIPVTEVAFRNQLFITLALQYAHEIGAERVFIGITAIDYSGYPDCRPEFLDSINALIKTQEKNIEVVAPLLHLYKAEIIDWGSELKVPYKLTTSCYKGGEKACGECDSCLLRLKGFAEAGKVDPIEYVRN